MCHALDTIGKETRHLLMHVCGMMFSKVKRAAHKPLMTFSVSYAGVTAVPANRRLRAAAAEYRCCLVVTTSLSWAL